VIRPATEADLPRLEELYRDFFVANSWPDYITMDLEEELREVAEYVRDHLALVEEQDGTIVAFALARLKGPRHGYVSDLYVAPEARRRGVAASLVRGVAEGLQAKGAEVLELEVQPGNTLARTAYERWGFREAQLKLAAPIEHLKARLAPRERAKSFGSIHVQSNEERTVDQILARFLPRLGDMGDTVVTPARNGWIAIYNERCDTDRAVQQRLAQELSEGMGVVVAFALEEGEVVRFFLFDHGRMVDEYLSVPDYYGALETVDALALAANPTLVARLTGADATRVRAVARTASSPTDLPPPQELLVQIAETMGIEGAERGYSAASE
jgi:ribosomal protein S18 acetylase RimI-like enzyme